MVDRRRGHALGGRTRPPDALSAIIAAALVLALCGGAAAAIPSHVVPPNGKVAASRPVGVDSAGLARFGDAPRADLGGGFVVLGGSPGAPAANPKTDTVYVPIQCRRSHCPSSGSPGHVVDVINAARCSSTIVSGCRVVATAKVGSAPLAAAIDPRTDTVYVTNGNDDTVSVLNGGRCNAWVTRGCGRPVATVKVGKFPVAAVVNARTRTLYVANCGKCGGSLVGGSVSVINTATCNAKITRGCRRSGRTVVDKASPSWLDVDTATDTIYVANSVTPGTVSVIDGAACNGHSGRGCGRVPATVTVGDNPFGLAVDQASDTVYVANDENGFNEGSVSVINGAACNAHTMAGCGRTPPEVPTGIGAAFVADDSALHTVFAVNQGDDTISAINSRTCNGTVRSACAKRPPNERATFWRGPGFNSSPTALALMGHTGTAYVVNEGGLNILSVTSIRRCNATNTTGCRAEAPAVRGHEEFLSADPATNTIYAGNINKPRIDVIDGATCHAAHRARCAPVATIPLPDTQANVGALDRATHTLYASNESSSGTVAVINTATCNASHTSGCTRHPPMVKVGAFPGPPALNPVTQTLYVPYGRTGNRVAVINAATCSATDHTGCGQTPAVVRVGTGTAIVAVSVATNTIYAPASGEDTVAVINGNVCNATHHAGCGHLAATAKVGLDPFGAVVNDRTHTLYVANDADGDSPGTVSVINTATCNGTTTRGCRGPFPTAATGITPLLLAADTRTGALYVTDFSSASVTILTTQHCNAAVSTGCAKASRERAVGSGPIGIAVNPHTATIYVANQYLPGSISILKATR